MECAYINGHQARFLLAADRLGMPVASGGVTILTRDTLQRIGGHQGFLNYIADDYSVVRIGARQLGQTTWLAGVMPRLPVGRRRWPDVWRRQVRWGSTRLQSQPRGEGAGAAGAGDRLARLGRRAGRGPACRWRRAGLWLGLAIALHTVAWLAAEAWFLAGRGLPFGPRAWAAALAREALVPLLAGAGLARPQRIDWRGTNLAAGWRPPRGWHRRKAAYEMMNAMDDIATVMLPEQRRIRRPRRRSRR